MRYRASFTPEAWVNDNAIEVDPEGPTEWDCTEFAQQHQEYLGRLAAWQGGWEYDGGQLVDDDDLFIRDPAAPEWVRQWRGPCTIHIEEVHT